MAIILRTPQNSFVRFGEPDSFNHPIYGVIKYCLPVFDENDHAFQFVLEGADPTETNLLLDLTNDIVVLGIVNDCGDPYLIQFTEKPERFKISDRQVLYNWRHGLPNFDSVIDVGECFRIRVEVQLYGITYEFCSTCFERIGDDAFTSVLEYGNDENAFGFNYCAATPVDPAAVDDCDPLVITFNNQSSLALPYTAQMLAKYGPAPSIQTWGYDGNGDLVNMGITETRDNIPPSMLNWDFGGNLSGIIVIKR